MKCCYEGCQEGHFCYGYHPAEWIPSDEGGYWIGDEYEWGACPCCEGVNFENCPKCSHLTKDAPDVVESAASSELFQAESESTSQEVILPATTQVI